MEQDIIIIGLDKFATTRGRVEADTIVLESTKADIIRQNLTKCIGVFASILQDAAAVGDFELSEVSLKVEVSAAGQVAFLGSGVSTAGTGGIELKFVKKQS